MLGRNLVAGLISSIWSALLGFAVIPLYLRYLGVESYGLIGFFATLQAMFQLLDMGLSPTLNREIAKCATPADWQGARALLHTLARVYWAMSAVIALAVCAAAPFIAAHWLRASQLTPDALRHTVVLLGLVIACRWPVGMYQGALMGAQRMTVASAITAVMTTASTLGAVAVLAFVSPTIHAFFIWQAVVGILYALSMRHAAWRAVGRDARMRFDLSALTRIWRFSAGMTVIIDGSDRTRARLERVLRTDPGIGIIRHADAGYPASVEAVAGLGLSAPMVRPPGARSFRLCCRETEPAMSAPPVAGEPHRQGHPDRTSRGRRC